MKRFIKNFLIGYSPDKKFRTRVIQNLEKRTSITDQEWYQKYYQGSGISISFVNWFRESLSKYFEYDISKAIPNDILEEDLGMGVATWSDVDWDIFEDFQSTYHTKTPNRKELKKIKTLDDFIRKFYNQIKK